MVQMAKSTWSIFRPATAEFRFKAQALPVLLALTSANHYSEGRLCRAERFGNTTYEAKRRQPHSGGHKKVNTTK